jgi:hypothetical protein
VVFVFFLTPLTIPVSCQLVYLDKDWKKKPCTISYCRPVSKQMETDLSIMAANLMTILMNDKIQTKSESSMEDEHFNRSTTKNNNSTTTTNSDKIGAPSTIRVITRQNLAAPTAALLPILLLPILLLLILSLWNETPRP